MQIAAIGLATAALLLAVTLNGSLNVLGTLTANVVDFSGAASTAPMKAGTTLPAACSVGQAFFKTDAPAGQNIHLCTASNTWSQVSGSGGGFDWKPSTRYVLFRTDFPAIWSQGSPAYLGDLIFLRQSGSTNINNPSYTTDGMHHGVATISTTSTSGNRTSWAAVTNTQATADGQSLFNQSNKPWEVVVVFRYPTASDFVASNFFLGLLEANANNPPRGLAVRYLAGTDTNFQFTFFTTANTWNGTTVDTGVAPDTNWHRLRIRSDGAVANKVWVSLDNGTEYSGCPSGCNITIDTWQSHLWSTTIHASIATNEAAVKAIQLDYAHLWRDLGTER
jgi:hypothetical protein